jgi:purine-binding chemotaxis protein CheW
MQEPTDPTLQIVVFTIDRIEYALRIEAVREIIRYVEPQPTSSSLSWLLGVINLRGSIVPIIELGARIGREIDERDPASAKVLVLEHGDSTIGAVVTSVDEVLRVDAAQVRPAPSGGGSSFVESVVTVDERMIMLLDAPSLLAIETRAA